MRWKKQGLVFVPQGDQWWARSHAYLPTAELIEDRFIRIYVAALDDDMYGRIGYLEVDAANPGRVTTPLKGPVLDLGEPGLFDDSGVSPSCIVNREGEKYLYYFGWQRMDRVPYLLLCGRARSTDGTSFERDARVPVLERTTAEPFVRSATTILPAADGYRMWYVSASEWVEIDDMRHPRYVIRHATSAEGKDWHVDDGICIDFETNEEYGFGRPWVLKDDLTYRMWYSIRSRTQPYRIGYAESADGYEWTRKDDLVGIAASETGWDSEMICFPCVVNARGSRYMFYNGNGHGKTGFGYAVLEQD